MESIIRFDFGNASVLTEPSFHKVERIYITSRYMWMNELRNRWHSTTLESPLRDLVYGEEGEFRIGLPRGEYRIRLQFFDPVKPWSPFTVKIGSVDAYAQRLEDGGAVLTVAPRQGDLLELEAQVLHAGGPLAIRFLGGADGFFVNGLSVFGEPGTELVEMYEEAPRDLLPTREEVLTNGDNDPASMLKSVCDWFCSHRLSGGFIGDFEGDMRLWYTASYPIRTLLAGYQLLGEPLYFEVAAHLLDMLVSEQMPEGSFTQACRGRKTEELSEEELTKVREKNWMNLADVGSMVASLAVACRYAEGERKERYLHAVRRYLDDWAMRYREENGGFTNGWVHHPAEKVYSVSTAATALTMGLFSKLTGEKKYLRIAEDAALLLAKDWNEDGRNWNFIFDGTYPGHDHYQGADEFGDGFYTTEALSAILALTDRKEVRDKLFTALRHYLFGSKGILAIKGDLPWWPLQNCWHNSKSAGNPILLLDFLRYGKEFGASDEELARVLREYEVCKRYLCSLKYATQIGVMLEDPQKKLPFPSHSIQCWTGCAVAAAGFGGIALAQMAQPGIIYLTEEGD